MYPLATQHLTNSPVSRQGGLCLLVKPYSTQVNQKKSKYSHDIEYISMLFYESIMWKKCWEMKSSVAWTKPFALNIFILLVLRILVHCFINKILYLYSWYPLMIPCLKVRCCKLTFSFWPISVHFNYMVPEMERTKEMKLWKDIPTGNAERRTTCSLSCRSGELKVLWFKCVPFLYVFTNDSIKVQVATSLFHYVFDKDTQSCSFSCISGELKILWFKCVPFLYVFTYDRIKVQVAT